MTTNKNISKKYFREITQVTLLLFYLIFFSQVLLLIHDEHFFLDKLILIDKSDIEHLVFRNSIFTQTLYLMLGIMTYEFFRCLYKEKWDKWIFISGAILALYGIYEFLFYFLFGVNGDFLSNRLMGDIADGEVAGLFQTLNIGSVQIMRLKSLTGEPSMYAFTMLAYWIYAIHRNEKIYAALFFITLCLSTSTSAFLGIGVYLILRIFYYGLKDKLSIACIVLLSLILVLFSTELTDFIQEIFVKKLMAENFSGEDRSNNIFVFMEYFIDMPMDVKLLGVGFGNTRSTDYFSTLLINSGIIGLALWTYVFFKPIFLLNRNYFFVGLKCIFIVDYIVMMISVPEFSYLFLWMFLGIAYNQIDIENNNLTKTAVT